jgi:flagellar basal body-associated protein FliL
MADEKDVRVVRETREHTQDGGGGAGTVALVVIIIILVVVGIVYWMRDSNTTQDTNANVPAASGVSVPPGTINNTVINVTTTNPTGSPTPSASASPTRTP